ncbi:MAG: hypothetical protein M3Q05_13690 [Bacteroidota bacterium]|nr:hypothetical protein [Bacteroidota bacterium]
MNSYTICFFLWSHFKAPINGADAGQRFVYASWPAEPRLALSGESKLPFLAPLRNVASRHTGT